MGCKDAENSPPDRRMALVLSILKGEVSAQEAAHAQGLTVEVVEAWVQRFLTAGEDALASFPADECPGMRATPAAPRGDVGVWICAVADQSLGPYLFMQAACEDNLLAELSVGWKRADRSPKLFEKTGAVSLLHGECLQLPQPENRLHLFSTSLHLFSTKMTETVSFEREGVLSDWCFPVRMAAVVVLLEKRHENDPIRRLSQTLGLRVSRTLTWVGAQQLPWVIAAMGYDSRHFSADSIRRRHELGPEVPIVPGPSPRPSHQLRPSQRSMTAEGEGTIVSLLLGRKNLSLDSDYAKRVIQALSDLTSGFATDRA